MKKRLIVTGGAGFIGSNLCDFLLQNNHEVVCIDNFDDYYDPAIKRKNIANALTHKNFTLIESDIKDIDYIQSKLSGEFDAIIHLAAKAGVRYSLEYPEIYFENNLGGADAICKITKRNTIKKIIFSSSSSVYGNNPITPWKENSDLFPLSPYAKSKLEAELIIKKFASKSKTDAIILRLFSVYGNRMRPDLMMCQTYESIKRQTALKIIGDGNSKRDYTHISDIIKAIYLTISLNDSLSIILNIGNGQPIKLNKLVGLFELKMNQKAIKEHFDLSKAEPTCTYADITKAKNIIGFNPTVTIEDGVHEFIQWKNSL